MVPVRLVDSEVVLNQINLVVADVAASADFYERLGVRFKEVIPGWSAHHRSGRAAGGVVLDLDTEYSVSQWDKGWPAGTRGCAVVLGFKVPSREDVDSLHDEIVAAGYQSQQAPYDVFWGARYAVVCDPDGNSVGLMSPIDSGRMSGPPSAS